MHSLCCDEIIFAQKCGGIVYRSCYICDAADRIRDLKGFAVLTGMVYYVLKCLVKREQKKMATNRILLIYNPKAGRGLFLHHLPSVIDLFVKAGFTVEVYPTQGSGDAASKIPYLTEEYYMIVAAGGDGTLDEVVTGITRSGKKTPIGYIPVGSTNDYAVSLGLSVNVMEAAGSIIAGKPHPVDVGIFNKDHVFIYVAAFGAFTDVAYTTNQDMKNALGHVAYLIEATKRLGDLKSYPMRVRLNGVTLQQDYIYGMVTNSISVGGIKHITGNEVRLDDGEFAVTLVRNPRNILEMQEIVGSLLMGNYDTALIDYFKTDHIELECPVELQWTFDGEYGGTYKNVEIENRARSQMIILEEGRSLLTKGK